ncbi:MAG: hypothetical protein GY866_40480 [Proteobacteria bacterium]|nr:hypothetical protein [Pseudomonadota bacterium]
MKSELYLTNRNDWRAWLEKNHATEREIWLVYYKKHTGKPRIPYDDAVEEALCFGWIDSIVKKIDDERYSQKFTPRKEKSNWSPLNKKRVDKLIEQGRMTRAGLELVENAKADGSWHKKTPSAMPFDIPAELERALSSNEKAKTFFDVLPPSSRKQYIGWIAGAKKDETREKRVKEAMTLLNNGRKLGMK